jgi:DNA (cytosine-5)-methyltransferase 1
MRSIELFAGCGGLALGISQAGFQHQLLIERDPNACSTIKSNIKRNIASVGGWPLLMEDVQKVDYSTWKGNVNLVSGGPPCQPFSIGGKHKGPNDKRNMWPEAIRCVREIRPEAFIFENVRGLLRPAFARYLEHIRLQLAWPQIVRRDNEGQVQYKNRLRECEQSKLNAGYHILIGDINTADFGAPQKRHRAIILGFRTDIASNVALPPTTHSYEALLWDQYVSKEYWERHRIPSRRRPSVSAAKTNLVEQLKREGKPAKKPWITVRDCIGDLPPPKNVSDILNHELHEGARIYSGHTGSQLDEPAKALKAGDHGVPGGENILVSGAGVRYFTIREMARLQGFPDDFYIEGAWVNSIKQLGNAVPVQIGRYFGCQIQDILRKKKNTTDR